MAKWLHAAFASTKTTVIAVCVVLVVIAEAVIAQVDEDPATIANYQAIFDAVVALLIALGFLASRDSDKSSQDVGIR